MACAITPSAMSQVREADNLDATDEIVRNIKDNYSIIYAFDNTASLGLFALDNGKDLLLYFHLLQKFIVNDFETDGKMVYFCGSYNGFGVIGFFDWYDVFFNGGHVNYVPCMTASAGGYIVVREYTKMDFFFDGSDLVFALVGNSVIDQLNPLNRTVISSAYMNPTSIWRFDHFYNKDGLITYTDIAALDDAVAVVGHNHGKDCYWKAFKQTIGFPTQPLNLGYATRISYTQAEGPSLIVRTGHNRAAVVHHGEGTLTTHLLEEDFLTERPTDYDHSYYITPQSPLQYSNTWTLYDLRYNNELYAYEEADHAAIGVTEPWVVNLPGTSLSSFMDAKYGFNGHPTSMSISNYSYKPILSGFSSTPWLSVYDPLDMSIYTPCDSYMQLTPIYGQPVFEDVMVSHDNPYSIVPATNFQPSIIATKLLLICH